MPANYSNQCGVTSAIKQRFEDGPNRVFAGGPLIVVQFIKEENLIGNLLMPSIRWSYSYWSPPYLGVFGLLQRRADYLFGQDT